MAFCTSVLRLSSETGFDSEHIKTIFNNAILLHLDGNKDDFIYVNNKYFDSQVQLNKIHPSQNFKINHQFLDDGILLLFDVSSHSNFDLLTNIHTSAESSGQCGKLIRLCIGIKEGDLIDNCEPYSRRAIWCLDRCFEYVEADLSNNGIQSGHLNREKNGFPRICEAINCTIWSNSILHAKRKKLEKSFESRIYLQSNFLHIGEKNIKENMLLKSSVTHDIRITNKFYKRNEEKNSNRFMDINYLEKVIIEAKQIRMASKNKILSDNERKKRASDAAFMLVNLLDNVDFENEKMGDISERNKNSF